MLQSKNKLIKELYLDLVAEKDYQVLDIVKNYFGVERVDFKIISFEVFKEQLESFSLFDVMKLIKYSYQTDNDVDERVRRLEKKYKVNRTDKIFDNLLTYLAFKSHKSTLFKNLDWYFCIYIYWEEVTIKNENNISHKLYDLYCRIRLQNEGQLIDFKFTRSSYTEIEIANDYMHSHVAGIDISVCEDNTPIPFCRNVCTGSSESNETIRVLQYHFDENLYELLCLHIEQFIRIESIHGVPYRHLDALVSSNDVNLLDNYKYNKSFPIFKDFMREHKELFNTFLKKVLEDNVLDFSFNGVNYYYSKKDIYNIQLISDYFIKTFNKLNIDYSYETLIDNYILVDAVIKNDTIKTYTKNNSYSSSYHYKQFINNIDTTLLFFKGKEIKPKIISEKENHVPNYMLYPTFCKKILDSILLYVNLNYGKKEKIIKNEGSKKFI